MQPPIKWTGSKRSQAKEIIAQFPKKIDTYWEPFLGGGSVLLALLESNIVVHNFVCTDQNADLIKIWEWIKGYPEWFIQEYEKRWHTMQKVSDKRAYYNQVRKEYNTNNLKGGLTGGEKAFNLFFLTRTCYSGLIRYNKDGEFNSAFHHTRKGIDPETLKKIIYDVSALLNKNDVRFYVRDFRNIIVSHRRRDFMYLDPPYFESKGMYHQGVTFEDLIQYLGELPCGYVLSYNGEGRESDKDVQVMPEDLYTEHLMSTGGKSSFGRLNQMKVYVRDSIYVKRNA